MALKSTGKTFGLSAIAINDADIDENIKKDIIGGAGYVFSVLVETFGVKQPQHQVENVMLPYFALLGVRLGNAVGAGSSSDRTQVQSLDDPRQSLDNPRRDECLGPPIEDYERDIAAKCQGLLKGLYRPVAKRGVVAFLVAFF